MTTTTYQSPILDVLVVTDNADALRRALSFRQFPLKIVCRGMKNDDRDNDLYWLTWGHRTEIAKAIANKAYSSVIYMEVGNRWF